MCGYISGFHGDQHTASSGKGGGGNLNKRVGRHYKERAAVRMEVYQETYGQSPQSLTPRLHHSYHQQHFDQEAANQSKCKCS